MGRVERYYDEKAEQEWGRLEKHRTEFAVTMRVLGEWLSRLWRHWRSALLVVKPDTVVRWHR